MAGKTPVTTAVGRLIGGSVTQLQDVKDNKGQPKLGKDGQPRKEIYFTLAIPKEAGHSHWYQTAWGLLIYQVGAAAFPQICQTPGFAWKIIDGDSAALDKKGKPWNSKANYPGNWVLRISSGYAPQIYQRNAAGTLQQIVDPNFLKLGYYVQVALGVSGNDSTDTPGVYLNPDMVCFSGYGEEIYIGPDAESAGFGGAPLPAGASAVPLGGGAMPALPGAAPAGLVPVPGAAYSIEQCRAAGWSDEQIVASGYAMRAAPVAPPAPMMPPAPPAPPAAPGMPPLPPGSSVPPPGAPGAPIAPVGLMPNPGFPQPPAAPGMPPAPPAPPAAPVGPQLTAAGAALGTYAGFLAQGWNDAQMRAAGYIV